MVSGVSTALSEAFTYDQHNRLLTSIVSNGSGTQPTVTYQYDSVGNITHKTDGGTTTDYGYGFSGAHPHAVATLAVASTTTASYNYDASGNMNCRDIIGSTCTGSPTGNVVWNSDNLPTNITQDANNYSNFFYGPDKHRYKQVAATNSTSETTLYLGEMEVVIGATTEYRHTLTAYGRPVYLEKLTTSTGGNPVETRGFALTDHLGSVDVIVDDGGGVQAQESFDVFGKRRNWGSWIGAPSSTEVQQDRTVTHHGFTHHEEEDNLGLVHMNGRVYDPTLGRFLSVDPVFGHPENSQSLNPYSYVLNNPLSMTDPTGYDGCMAGDLCFSSGEHNRDSKGNLITKDAQQISDMKNGTTKTIGSFLVSKDADGNVAVTTSNGSQSSANSNDAQNKPSDSAGIGSPQQVSKTPSTNADQVEVIGTDSSKPKDDIHTQDVSFTLSPSDKNASGGYQYVTEAVLAQFRANQSEYEQTEKNGDELMGVVYKPGSNYFFSTMHEVPAQFDAHISLVGIRSQDIAGYTHTHPDNTIFNGLDYVTPANTRLPSFMRNSAGNAYQWSAGGALRYQNYVKQMQQSGSAMSQQTDIADPGHWGITSICPGGTPCLN